MNVKTLLAAKALGGDIISIKPSADLAAAAKLLSAQRVGALLIRGAAALSLQVSEVMTRNVATCGEDDSLASIMEQMTAGKFRHMPVVSKGELVGLVSIGDVVKQRVDEIEHESEALRDYIRTA
jgi:predicted transcriptional regulator